MVKRFAKTVFITTAPLKRAVFILLYWVALQRRVANLGVNYDTRTQTILG